MSAWKTPMTFTWFWYLLALIIAGLLLEGRIDLWLMPWWREAQTDYGTWLTSTIGSMNIFHRDSISVTNFTILIPMSGGTPFILISHEKVLSA